MNNFIVKIATPDGELFSGEAKSITVKTIDGDVQIMKGHADYFAALGTGRARLVLTDSTERSAACSGGFIVVAEGEARVVATTFEFADDIDVSRAERARVAAEEALSIAKEQGEIDIAKAKLTRALLRISVGNG